MAAMNRPRMMLRIEREETQSVIGKARQSHLLLNFTEDKSPEPGTSAGAP